MSLIPLLFMFIGHYFLNFGGGVWALILVLLVTYTFRGARWTFGTVRRALA
jgi:hypothetical protein